MDWIIYGILALTAAGWLLLGVVYNKLRKYFLPHIINQLGLTLLMISLFVIGGWEGMGVGMIALMIIGAGLLMALSVFVYSRVKKKRPV
ncbi:YesK family protein [Evansella clarkii]|uniref:YesK family protein n=1 Tax=Evansella clarkii TaxID=79879 RepID=UPI000998787E|nr:YesK family protein [Evansella clarkii]